MLGMRRVSPTSQSAGEADGDLADSERRLAFRVPIPFCKLVERADFARSDKPTDWESRLLSVYGPPATSCQRTLLSQAGDSRSSRLAGNASIGQPV